MAEFDYYTECKKVREEILAKHPRMSEPCFRAALGNMIIERVAPKLMASKRNNRRGK